MKNILQLATECISWVVISHNIQTIIFSTKLTPVKNLPIALGHYQITIFQMGKCWWPCQEKPLSQSLAGCHPNSGPEPFLRRHGKMFVWSESWSSLLGAHGVWKTEKKSPGWNAAGMSAFLACRSEQIIVHLLWTNLSGRGSLVRIVLLMEGKTFLHHSLLQPSVCLGDESVLGYSSTWLGAIHPSSQVPLKCFTITGNYT